MSPPSSHEATASYACVAAFVTRSLAHFGHTEHDVATIARQLDVRVLSSDANPWGLRNATDADHTGLSLEQARHRIPALLSEVAPELRFRHVAFSEIWGRMADDLAVIALQRNCSLGLGFNFAHLNNYAVPLRHVSLVLTADATGLTIDERLSTEDQPVRLDWNSVWAAVSDIDGGFWLIGHASTLSFDYAPSERSEANISRVGGAQ